METLDEVSRIHNAAILSTDDEMAELIADIETNRELVKRLTAESGSSLHSARSSPQDGCGSDRRCLWQ